MPRQNSFSWLFVFFVAMNSLPSPRISFGELGKRVFGGEAEDGVGGGIVGEGAEGGAGGFWRQHRLVVLDPWQRLHLGRGVHRFANRRRNHRHEHRLDSARGINSNRWWNICRFHNFDRFINGYVFSQNMKLWNMRMCDHAPVDIFEPTDNNHQNRYDK